MTLHMVGVRRLCEGLEKRNMLEEILISSTYTINIIYVCWLLQNNNCKIVKIIYLLCQ